MPPSLSGAMPFAKGICVSWLSERRLPECGISCGALHYPAYVPGNDGAGGRDSDWDM